MIDKKEKIDELISILWDETNSSGINPDEVIKKLILEYNTRQTNSDGKLEFKNVLIGAQFNFNGQTFLKLNKNYAYIDPMLRLNPLLIFHPCKMVVVERKK